MSEVWRVLRFTFASFDSLVQEYTGNLANGGLFLPGAWELVHGEAVLVWLDLAFLGRTVEIRGRVAQSIPLEIERSGGRAGIGIEVLESPDAIRERLEAALGRPLADGSIDPNSTRSMRRSVAQVRARLRNERGFEAEGETRNLSLVGVLVALDVEPPPVDAEVEVSLTHPTTGEAKSIRGRVVRYDRTEEGIVRGVGIAFDPASNERDVARAFLRRIQSTEHVRRLGGISGTLATLSIPDLLGSFGQCVPCGRFSILRDGDVGTIHVERGLVAAARIRGAVGLKAIARLLTWSEGKFEFHANLRPDASEEPLGLPIDGALLEATRFLDEDQRRSHAPLSRSARVTLRDGQAPLEPGSASKLEASVVDLTGAEGADLGVLLDRIQAPDSTIEATVLALVEREIVQLAIPQAKANEKA